MRIYFLPSLLVELSKSWRSYIKILMIELKRDLMNSLTNPENDVEEERQPQSLTGSRRASVKVKSCKRDFWKLKGMSPPSFTLYAPSGPWLIQLSNNLHNMKIPLHYTALSTFPSITCPLTVDSKNPFCIVGLGSCSPWWVIIWILVKLRKQKNLLVTLKNLPQTIFFSFHKHIEINKAWEQQKRKNIAVLYKS